MTYKIKKSYQYKEDSQIYNMFLGKIISKRQNHYVFDEKEALEVKTLKAARDFVRGFKNVTSFQIINENGRSMKI